MAEQKLTVVKGVGFLQQPRSLAEVKPTPQTLIVAQAISKGKA